MTFAVTPLSDAMGARVTGLDLSKPISKDMFEQVLAAWYEHLVLVFTDQNITNEQHINFSSRFGPPEIHPEDKYLLDDHPEILLLTNRKDQKGDYISLKDGGSVWHSDLSYMDHPSRCSLLYGIEVPPDGGDTEWINMYKAYETLPKETKKRIANLNAAHQFDNRLNPRLERPKDASEVAGAGSIWSPLTDDVKARTPDAIHPIVRTHPDTGRKALFINRRFTIKVDGMDPDEGENLLLDLISHAENPDFSYRHTWAKGELVLWDNRCTMHIARGGVPEGQIRTMQRVTITGDRPY